MALHLLPPSDLAFFCVTATILSLICAPLAVRGTDYTQSSLQYGFYRSSCPDVEKIIFASMYQSFQSDSTVAPGVLRMAYHDCFVRGCDASVLLDGPNTEKTHPINLSLHGYNAIDAAKAAVEQACPGVVSCADVLQFAVRDSVILTGGQGYFVPSGRRDGTVSIASEVPDNLMTPDKTVPVLLQAFAKKGLSADQMVALQGAHTIGKSHCVAFDNRLWTYDSPSKVDPTLPASFVSSLKQQCPGPNLLNSVDLDLETPAQFDSDYYKNIQESLGLLTSDQSMLEDSRTKYLVEENTDNHKFNWNFAQAMVALSQIEVLTGNAGQIRRQCNVVN